MTHQEAIDELEELRGIADNGESLAPYKERIGALYLAVCGKALRNCNCKDVLPDALAEIYSTLKSTENIKDINMAKARLVSGVVLLVGGTHYTNKNLTDEVARVFLEKFPMRKDWFEVLPPAEEKETPENGAETAPKSEKSAKQVTTPKAKKTPSKRK